MKGGSPPDTIHVLRDSSKDAQDRGLIGENVVHDLGAPAHLAEGPLYGVGGADCFAMPFGASQERQKGVEVLLQTGRCLGSLPPPALTQAQ